MPKTKARKSSSYIYKIAMVVVIIGCLGVGAGLGLVAGTLQSIPGPEALTYRPNLPTEVYDRNGQLITRFMTENRISVSLDQIPTTLQNAFIAIEDQQFWTHKGINPFRIIGALIADIRAGSKVQGGSTITQQFAKLAFLTSEKTLLRKIQDAIYAIQLERKYTKQQILEWYLNEIYLGHGTYGVEAAAQLYFGKHVGELSLAECALIAGLNKSPENLSPIRYPDRAKARRDLVLTEMAKEHYITQEQAQQAMQEPIVLSSPPVTEKVAQQFIEHVRKYLCDKYGTNRVYRDGLKVYTTLDLGMQREAERAIEAHLPTTKTVDASGNAVVAPQAALVTVETSTGYIRAMVGGRGDTDLNRAVQTARQPGSSFKVFVYTTALREGLTPYTFINDEPVSEDPGTHDAWPNNWDKVYEGLIPLRYGIARSKNAASVQLLKRIGVDDVIRTAELMGISTLVKTGTKTDRVDALALGGLTVGVIPLEMASAYAILANGGIRVEPMSILRVEDRFGTVLEENSPHRQIVLDEATAYLMTDMLSDVIYSQSGTGKSASIGRPAAGKTGTTTSNVDAWFVGYTPDLSTAVWIGNDDQSVQLNFGGRRLTSSDAAAIWGNYMGSYLKGKPVKEFTMPDDVVSVKICKETGELATELCTNTTEQLYKKGTEPQTLCSLHNPEIPVVKRRICKDSGLLATVNCPESSIVVKTYQLPSGREVGKGGIIPGSQMPSAFCDVHGPPTSASGLPTGYLP